MPHIKRLHLNGFKSFAKPTDIIFDRGLNILVGSNGAGKSNLADSICFVLGRLRVRSLRATRAANLIYNGGKTGKPSQRATVSMVFDNSDGAFVLPASATSAAPDSSEVEIMRIVKKDGTSTYKINGQTKTRQEILELLSQAGIDPEGFNIILQAEISQIITLHPEEKRGIIEDIAGISVYEARKEKSLNELGKTEEKLKAVRTILNERSAYMRNLEKEKAQAEHYKQLKAAVRRDRAALAFKLEQEKREGCKQLDKRISARKEELNKAQEKISAAQSKVITIDKQIQSINDYIERSSGFEQEELFTQLSSLREGAAVLSVKISNYIDQLHSVEKRAEQLRIDQVRLEQEVKQLEQERARAQAEARELDAETFKAELLKAASQLKKQSKVLESAFSELATGIKERKQQIDDLLKENKIKVLHQELGAFIYFVEEHLAKLQELSKGAESIAGKIAGFKIGEGEKRNIDLELELARKELERAKEIIKKSGQEEKELEQAIAALKQEQQKKQQAVQEKEKAERKLRSSFEKLLLRKSKEQEAAKKQELLLREQQAKAKEIESGINTLNIAKARADAELEVASASASEYADLKEQIEEIKRSKAELESRIARNENKLAGLGSVNLRALEVYDRVKAEYDSIAAKVEKLEQEKAEILKIIEEIDKKKKQAFMQAFNAINTSFSKNFATLDSKGRAAFLELESKQEPFSGGLDIMIKLAKGKYMDADSLSGGEKVMVALALIFAIQQYRPYCFYIFDEIDPALDKRNSERFAALLRENVKASQCIMITHNDAVINQADTLYGASMQDGISKIISLKV